MKDVLLEIGTEEIPARLLPGALSSLADNARKALDQAGLSFERLHTMGTPRRLALWVEGLAPHAKEQVREFLGPAVAQSKNAEGQWTPAALGFARAQGLAPEQLEVRPTERGPRLAAVHRLAGAPTGKLLPDLLKNLIQSLPFPKSMVWESQRFPFVRPLRWIVALYGTQGVKLEVAGVKAGRKTRGLRFHSRKPFDVTSPAKYVGLLRNHCVLVDPAERRAGIVQQIHHQVKSHHGHVPVEKFEDLLTEVTHLVEHPVAVLGSFEERHLALPSEVLVTSMKRHQKFFPVFDGEGRLLPRFVGLRNGFSDHQAVVREGYERVLAARLADANFFFEQDRKKPLADRVGDLQGIAFLSPRLTLKDKTERTIALVDWAAARLSLAPVTVEAARRIAWLGKADLTTGVVGEFPELQGVMGRIYAAADGEPGDVPVGVEQHYWPLTAEGTLPTLESAALVSLVDKVDTLAGNFLIGKIPSGSQDPYGLRRAAIGVLRILEERDWPLSLGALTEAALAALPDFLGDRALASRALGEFFRQRWAAYRESQGERFDEVDAVTAGGLDFIADAARRLRALRDIRRHPDFEPLSVAFKRASNLLKQAEKKGEPVPAEAPGEDLFSLPAEKTLRSALRSAADGMERALVQRDHAGAWSALVGLRGPVDAFFKDAVVMDPDAAVRARRLALLAAVRRCFDRLADLSRLQDVQVKG